METGGVLGLFCGLMTKTLLSLTSLSYDEVISFQYEVEKNRLDLFKQGVSKHYDEKAFGKEALDLLKEREKKKKEMGI